VERLTTPRQIASSAQPESQVAPDKDEEERKPMPSKEQNERLTRVENGSPTGRMLRDTFWFPFALSSAIEIGAPPEFGDDPTNTKYRLQSNGSTFGDYQVYRARATYGVRLDYRF
jgi:hypothetical protein